MHKAKADEARRWQLASQGALTGGHQDGAREQREQGRGGSGSQKPTDLGLGHRLVHCLLPLCLPLLVRLDRRRLGGRLGSGGGGCSEGAEWHKQSAHDCAASNSLAQDAPAAAQRLHALLELPPHPEPLPPTDQTCAPLLVLISPRSPSETPAPSPTSLLPPLHGMSTAWRLCKAMPTPPPAHPPSHHPPTHPTPHAHTHAHPPPAPAPAPWRQPPPPPRPRPQSGPCPAFPAPAPRV